MRIKEMRSELESYGISTKTFLEKREFLDALKKARDEGMAPTNGATKEPAKADTTAAGEYADAYSYYNQQNGNTQAPGNNGYSNGNAQANANGYSNGSAQTDASRTQTNGSQQANNNNKTPGVPSRADRLEAEIKSARNMRVSELKQKLKDMGVNTKSFFEKTEFVRAYAEAMVDGINSGPSQSQQQEGYDPDYRDVVVQKFDPKTQQRYLLGGTIIDITL